MTPMHTPQSPGSDELPTRTDQTEPDKNSSQQPHPDQLDLLDLLEGTYR